MNKISVKTFLFFSSCVIILLLIFDLVTWKQTKNFIVEGIRQDLRGKLSLSQALAGEIEFDQFDKVEFYKFSVGIKSITSLRTTLIDKKGLVVADSEIPVENLIDVENHLYRPEVQEALRTGSGLAVRTSTTIKEKLFYYCEPVREDGRITGFIRLAMFAPEYDHRLDFLTRLIVLSNLYFVVLLMLVVWIYVTWLKNQFSYLRLPIYKQRDKQKFVQLPRQKNEEIDLISNEINILGKKLEEGREKLSSQREQLLTIFNSLNEGVAAFNKNGIAILHNLAFREILGVSANHENSIHFYDWIHFPPIIQDIEDFLKKGVTIKKRTKFYGDRYLDYQILPLMMNDAPLEGFLLTLADVTHLQQLETIRQDFVANVSHEFKTPLTSIRGYAETLLSGMVDKKKEREKFLGKIEKQTVHLENLVTDLLQLSRIEKKKMDDLEKMNPIPIIKKFISESESMALEKNIGFHKEIAKFDKKIHIKANEHLFQIIIFNLISNAVQYNRPEGEIWFRLLKTKKNLRMEIEDSGSGIPVEYQDRIFERFYRVESTRYMFPEGSGLGLSIVKHAVEILKGRIGVKSEEEKGSIFWIEIPLI